MCTAWAFELTVITAAWPSACTAGTVIAKVKHVFAGVEVKCVEVSELIYSPGYLWSIETFRTIYSLPHYPHLSAAKAGHSMTNILAKIVF